MNRQGAKCAKKHRILNLFVVLCVLGVLAVRCSLWWDMVSREREYHWYLTGCDRLGQTPIGEAEFAARWQEFEDHAERLKAAEAEGKFDGIEADMRAVMQQRVKDDPFVKAILVGMAENEP